MIRPKADSRLLWLRFSGLFRFSFSALLLDEAFFISSIRFVFEIMGITFSTTGVASIGLGFFLSTVWLFLNCSIVKSPPNTFSLYLFGAGDTVPLSPYIRRRIMIMYEDIMLPFVIPCLSRAYVFMQLHEQKLPATSKRFPSIVVLIGHL